jgi:hypothetical protein
MGVLDREVGIAVAATAAVASPRAREVARRGAVYGLAGAMRAGDVLLGTARGAVQGAQRGFSTGAGDGDAQQSAANGGSEAAAAPATRARRRTPGPTTEA